MQKGLKLLDKIQLVKKLLTFIKLIIWCLISKCHTLESVLSDISYSRVEDSLDSDRNFEDAQDCWEPEVLGTVKRKRISGITNSNGVKKEIEVIMQYSIEYQSVIKKLKQWFFYKVLLVF